MQEQFKRLVKKIHPFLKQRGFLKTNLTFTRNRDEIIEVINLQKSAYNTQQDVRFYVNYGIYCAAYDEMIDKRVIQKPKEYDCQIRLRIDAGKGFEMSVWTEDELCEVILSGIEQTLETFAPIQDAETVATYLQKAQPFNYGLFEFFLKTARQSQAMAGYEQAKQKFGQEERWARIYANYEKVARKYSLKLEAD